MVMMLVETPLTRRTDMTMKLKITLASAFSLFLSSSIALAESTIMLEMELAKGEEVISEPTLVMGPDGASFAQGIESDQLVIRYEFNPSDPNDNGFNLDINYSFERLDSRETEEGDRDLHLAWGEAGVVRVAYPSSGEPEDSDLILSLIASEITEEELEALQRGAES